MIELQHVSAGYGAQDVVRDVSFAAPNGQLTALIGPNGSGKTTLLRAMTRTLPCRSGNILLDDRSIASYGRKEFARTAAFMPPECPKSVLLRCAAPRKLHFVPPGIARSGLPPAAEPAASR